MRVTSNATKRARSLRKSMSLPEVLLWRHLRGREPGKPVFRRQHPVGPYVLDFYCPSRRICFEIDGEAHHLEDRPQRDARRDGYLRRQGMRVVRIPASYVLADPYGIAQRLIGYVQDAAAPPCLSEVCQIGDVFRDACPV
ncbi:endonuclease domain-containing protein, partial [Phenylobacterium sp.]|uniref:endonuclease domain-containing protein n=1 Tax=Phenylobacterium sp. TaxID=1871053 RepID=UPI0037CBA473